MLCPLCASESRPYFQDDRLGWSYDRCPCCELTFMHPAHRLAAPQERERYLLHENDTESPGYVQFLQPLIDGVKARVAPGAAGLDYGCGPTEALAELLRRAGYQVDVYDPFFADHWRDLRERYDFITVSEAAEHFHQPLIEFTRMRDKLRAGGVVGVYTLRLGDEVDFANWYYRRDPTHVAFYRDRTFEWLGAHMKFAGVEFDSRAAWLRASASLTSDPGASN